MTRPRFLYTRSAPSYFEHAHKIKPDGAVIMGPHFDLASDDPDALRDPFKVARPFAHAIALETGEPFAWGWYNTGSVIQVAVCAVELVPPDLRVYGRTDRLTDNEP